MSFISGDSCFIWIPPFLTPPPSPPSLIRTRDGATTGGAALRRSDTGVWGRLPFNLISLQCEQRRGQGDATEHVSFIASKVTRGENQHAAFFMRLGEVPPGVSWSHETFRGAVSSAGRASACRQLPDDTLFRQNVWIFRIFNILEVKN